MLQNHQKKRLLKLTKHSELRSFANMVAKSDIDVLKIKEQINFKLGWKFAKN